MAANTTTLQKNILEVLEETFERVHGIYLDKGASFFETLEPVSSEEASLKASDQSASVAAHVKHVTFYLRVLQDSIRGNAPADVNWREIWESDRPVTAIAWRSIVADLREEYARVGRFVNDPGAWEHEDAVGGFLAIAAHTAYHLGAVRQALAVIRARART
jgi:DinB family protein